MFHRTGLLTLCLIAALSASAPAGFAVVPPDAFDTTTAVSGPSIVFGFVFYSPARVLIAPGQEVSWAGSFLSHPFVFNGEPGAVSTGTFSTRTFPEPGTFTFVCFFHGPSMGGVVYVQGSPKAALTSTPVQGVAGTPMTLDASGSSELHGDITAYAWDIDGDGTFERSTGATPTTTATFAPGEHKVAVRVTDTRSRIDAATLTVTVAPAPAPAPTPATSPASQPPADVAAPSVTARAPATIVSRRLASSGLAVRVGSSEPAVVEVRLLRGRTILGRARGTTTGRATTFRVRPPARLLRRLRAGTRLTILVLVTDAAGNRARSTRTLRIT